MPRYDLVVLYDLADKEFNTREGIDRYIFSQVHLFFELVQDNIVHKFAYLEWYNITDVPEGNKMVPRDLETRMHVASRSGEFNIVCVDAIIRMVYMQPFFKDCDLVQKHLE